MYERKIGNPCAAETMAGSNYPAVFCFRDRDPFAQQSMKKLRSVIIASLLMLISGCHASTLDFDYQSRLGKKSSVYTPSGTAEVQVKLTKGLRKPEPPGSLTTSFVVEGNVITGQVPNHPRVKTVLIRLYHDWTDRLLTNNAVLTLRFTPDGSLFDIKDFIVTGIGSMGNQ